MKPGIEAQPGTGVQPDADGLYRRARPFLGTLVEIGLDRADEEVFEAGYAAISHIHSLMSFHEADSDLARLRQARPGSITQVSAETFEVLQTAIRIHAESGGLFDVTVGRKLVRFGYLPREGLVHLNRFGGTMHDIHLLDGNRIGQDRLPLIDLGGIAKGYAVDCAVTALIASGVSGGIVNAGGDLRVFGDCRLTVTLRGGNGRFMTLEGVRETAIASSENRHTRRRRWGSTVSPHIGPEGVPVVVDGLVTVAADRCMLADAVTKIAMIDQDVAERLLAPHNGRVLCRVLVN